ncbi:hypothetical protein [Nonomuraea endophytica]|uniref:hypothetical protein n=1 Tax=Nonomuraea endophytica TaxID=714136 RepID=UPI0037C98F45
MTNLAQILNTILPEPGTATYPDAWYDTWQDAIKLLQRLSATLQEANAALTELGIPHIPDAAWDIALSDPDNVSDAHFRILDRLWLTPEWQNKVRALHAAGFTLAEANHYLGRADNHLPPITQQAWDQAAQPREVIPETAKARLHAIWRSPLWQLTFRKLASEGATLAEVNQQLAMAHSPLLPVEIWREATTFIGPLPYDPENPFGQP